jgi:hypothetical protein
MEANGKRLRTTMTATGDNFMNHLEAIVRIKSAANVFALLARVKQILLREDFGNAHGYATVSGSRAGRNFIALRSEWSGCDHRCQLQHSKDPSCSKNC